MKEAEAVKVPMGVAEPEPEEGVPLAAARRGGGGAARLRRLLPAARWLPRYGRAAAAADLVAGVTLGLTLVPQSIAYASLANLPVQYGLYSAFAGTMLYAALGTVKEVSIGPTSLMALLTLQTCHALPPDCVVLLTFLSGCVVFLMGLLRLGFLVDLISPSVTSGFTSATAVIVVVAQLKGLLGLSFVAESVFENVLLIYQKIGEVRLPDCILSVVCCSVLLALRKLKDLPVSPKRRRLRRALWLLSIARNALVVLAAAAAAALAPDRTLFRLSGRVEQGLPRVSLPPFSTTIGNRTVGFVEMVSELGSGVVMLPVVMVLANTAIAKAFTEGGRVAATQEMLTLGLCNVAGSLVRAMPSCGAFTRSAVAHSSGVRTPAAALVAGIIPLLALNYLTKYFYFIPKACLSSVLICAVIFMIDVEIVFRLWRRARGEAGVLLLTLAVGVARSVELAVAAGALAAATRAAARLLRAPPPPRRLQVRDGDAIRIRTGPVLLYVNAERFAERVLAAALPAPDTAPAPAAPPPVLVDCSELALLDYTAAEVLGRVIREFEARRQRLVFYNAAAAARAQLAAVPGLDARALPAARAQPALDAVARPAPPA
ncbi:sodium-independent sulfate anion transporter-like, partial [Epargyreus clarus]|uniref:sodium-independent sulfate anion transporter-like n=1 Tax=Epargyreus clarus TaxID=520877 RepID=UPI003C2E5830